MMAKAASGESSTITWANRDKWVMGILGAIVTSGILFLCATIYTDHMATATLKVAVANIESSLGEIKDNLKQQTSMMYTAEQAARDQTAAIALIGVNSSRVDKLESHIERLNDRLTRMEERTTERRNP